MQSWFRSFVVRRAESLAKQLLAKHAPKIIVVTGSIGKTSTKLAIATVLSQQYRVMAHFGSYNTHIALPLALFNEHVPDRVGSLFAWLAILKSMRRKLEQPFPYDVVVIELGADHPGEIAYFKKYLVPDISVVTAVAPERMMSFGSIDAVAAEELSVVNFSKRTFINRDDVAAQFAGLVPQGAAIDTYGTNQAAEYHFTAQSTLPGQGFVGQFTCPEFGQFPVQLTVLGHHNIRPIVAAGAVGIKLGLTPQQVANGMQAVRPLDGRMNLLRGLNDSWLIDDTYNSSPAAAQAALQTLYSLPVKHRIAVLGSMNELGAFSAQAHQELGAACDPAMLDWVVTIGAEAERYIAPAAGSRGCQVRSFSNPYEAGTFVHSVLPHGAAVLVKGSQNGVFAEETVKMLLHSAEDEKHLVRQTTDWLAIKDKEFGRGA